jgi:hypothetical protein
MMGSEYDVWTFMNNQFTPAFNVTFQMGEVGQRIVALTSGSVFIYSTKFGLRSWNAGVLTTVNTTQPGGFREYPAIVGYLNGFFVHGGLMNGTATTDFWYYDADHNVWQSKNSSGIPASYNHTLTLSTFPVQSAGNTVYDLYVYFTGLPLYSIILFDNTANMSTIPMTKYQPTAREWPLTTIAGNLLFIFGGKDRGSPLINNDIWQLVNERFCTSVSNCDDCVGYVGCTFCSSAVSISAPSCVAGNSSHAYIGETCGSAVVISQVESCPEAFPSWAIALIVIGGVILVGGIVFGIMKLRAVKPGYDPV